MSDEDKEFLQLLMTRKNTDLAEYIFSNLEWDTKPYCMMDYPKNIKPNEEICNGCDFIENCPDGAMTK